MADLEIGCSGFNYPHWRGAFYQEGMPQTKWLEYYSAIFSSVELNVTFYRLPKRELIEQWSSQVPPEFRFVIKASHPNSRTARWNGLARITRKWTLSAHQSLHTSRNTRNMRISCCARRGRLGARVVSWSLHCAQK